MVSNIINYITRKRRWIIPAPKKYKFPVNDFYMSGRYDYENFFLQIKYFYIRYKNFWIGINYEKDKESPKIKNIRVGDAYINELNYIGCPIEWEWENKFSDIKKQFDLLIYIGHKSSLLGASFKNYFLVAYHSAYFNQISNKIFNDNLPKILKYQPYYRFPKTSEYQLHINANVYSIPRPNQRFSMLDEEKVRILFRDINYAHYMLHITK